MFSLLLLLLLLRFFYIFVLFSFVLFLLYGFKNLDSTTITTKRKFRACIRNSWKRTQTRYNNNIITTTEWIINYHREYVCVCVWQWCHSYMLVTNKRTHLWLSKWIRWTNHVTNGIHLRKTISTAEIYLFSSDVKFEEKNAICLYHCFMFIQENFKTILNLFECSWNWWNRRPSILSILRENKFQVWLWALQPIPMNMNMNTNLVKFNVNTA